MSRSVETATVAGVRIATSAVEVCHVSKSFGPTRAVADVAFAVEPGTIFGLLGPNGAGKTTTIRLVLDIFRPDSGSVSILGGPMTERKKDRIGYMPEERGLYQDVPLEQCLVYLAMLKGLTRGEARRRARLYLERLDLAQHRDSKVKQLSKGMQQKAQIISTILHHPDLVIMDEPFSGLDPINTQMVKDLLLDLRAEGAAIVMSTHQMHQVEEMCGQIVLIDRGRNVLEGELGAIRRRFAGRAVLVQSPVRLPSLAGVVSTEPHNGALRLALAEQATPQDVLGELVAKNVPIERFEVALPSLDEIFIRVVERGETG